MLSSYLTLRSLAAPRLPRLFFGLIRVAVDVRSALASPPIRGAFALRGVILGSRLCLILARIRLSVVADRRFFL